MFFFVNSRILLITPSLKLTDVFLVFIPSET